MANITVPRRSVPGRWHPLMLACLLMVPLLPAGPTRAAAPVILRVSANGQKTPDCGTSWVNACDLQYALQNRTGSPTDNYELLVQGGTYYPSELADDYANSFFLKNRVALYGGFNADGSARDWLAYPSILSGDIDHADPALRDLASPATDAGQIRGRNANHVVAANQVDETAILDGFIISGGQASGIYSQDSSGGGIWVRGGSPVLRHLIIEGNTASYFGGGLAASASSPTISNVTFTGNQGTFGGGMDLEGMYGGSVLAILVDARFNGNQAQEGGGLRIGGDIRAELTGVTFESNSASQYGGGLDCQTSQLTLTNSTFTGNTVTGGSGGGMAIHAASGNTIQLQGVLFQGNSASAQGGGLYNDSAASPTLTQVRFLKNQANWGGGMADRGANSPVMNMIRFEENQAMFGGGLYTTFGASPTLTGVNFDFNSARIKPGTDGQVNQGVGGGMFAEGAGQPVLRQAEFWGNLADQRGGGLYLNNGARVTLNGSFFFENQSGGYGGGIALDSGATLVADPAAFIYNQAITTGGGLHNGAGAVSLNNSVFYGNRAATGAAVYNSYGTAAALGNVTITSNVATQAGGGLYNDHSDPLVQNSILWGNNPDSLVDATGSQLMVKYSDIQAADGQVYPGVGNLNEDPLLGPPGLYGGDFPTIPLLPGSPAIDAGDLDFCPPADQRGVQRPQGARCDLGAYETRAFELTLKSGDMSFTPVLAPFSNPLVVSVTSPSGDPVNGGQVRFTAPAAGASLSVPEGWVSIQSGEARLDATANRVVGSYLVTAHLPGLPGVDFHLTNTKAQTTTGLQAAPSPGAPGQPVTLRAVVSAKAPSSGPAEGGKVTFYDGDRLLQEAALGPDGQASLVITDLAVGAHKFRAVYSGWASYETSTGALDYTAEVKMFLPAMMK